MQRINVAILGAGNIAGSMATALSGLKEEVCMYAVASRSLEKAQAFADKWGFEKAYGSYEELAKDSNVDLIYVATPHSEHYNNTKLCLMNGRNCLVEKAFCGNLKQSKELIELAKEKNLLLAEAMWTRYLPFKEIVSNLLSDGVIGNVHYMESDFSVPIPGVERMTNPALAGGALLDLGVYSLTVPAMFLGTDIKKVSTSAVITDTGVDATTVVMLTYADGTKARAKCSFVDSMSNYGKIVGDKGYIEWGPINVPENIRVYNPEGELVKCIDTPYRVNGYEYEVLECRRMLLAGCIETESMPWSETIRLMGWMDSIRNHIGVVFPFETKEDIALSDMEVWGVDNVYDDSNPWDRSNTTSFLETYDIETGKIETLATIDGVIEAPNWSHNGRFLTYNGNGYIYRYDLSSGLSVQIDSWNLKKINNDHVLSADDTEIAVSDETDFDGRSRIYRIPLNGSAPILVTQEAPSYLHGWNSVDGYMCYCAERGGQYDVYEMDLATHKETRLTTAPGLNDGCEYDSTGEYIYFNSVRCGLMQAFRMKRDGSEQIQLTFDTDLNTWFPHISPDGKKIVMVAYHKGDLWPGDHVPNCNVLLRMMDADGSNLKTIVELFGGQGTINVNSWSPDSKKFAYVRYEKR